jgi:META domain-containing protein
MKALPLMALAAGAALLLAPTTAHSQDAFPFGRESTLEIAPLTGTKRLPTLDIDDNGVADLDLWCANMKVRLIVVADTITVVTGPKTERPCPPEQARADEEILAALAQVANWRLEEDTLVLTGGPTELRFRLHTN